MVPETGAPRRITSGRTEGFDGLAVAGNGRVFYASTENQQPDLWSMKVDGTDIKRLTHDGCLFPSVSRDGRFVTFVSAEGGIHHIWRIDSDGKNRKQLTFGDGESYPNIAPDGKLDRLHASRKRPKHALENFNRWRPTPATNQ